MTQVPNSLQTGDPAPDFALPDQDNKLFSLSKQKGQWVVIYFYPKASTPGCTTQACDVQAHEADWARLGATVVGISPDPLKALVKFRQEAGLDFPLLSDADHTVASLYGAWQEKSMYGRIYWGNARMTYIIDPDGRVAYVQPKVKPTEHAREMISWLETTAA